MKEPTAWQHKVAESWVTTTKDGEDDEWIPLYTHPVKQLSDEEMYKLAEQCGFNVDGKVINDGIETAADFHRELFMFARAIIKEITE